ncbi:hypothetical protein BH10ACT8_BH10ACT8_10900 [soil metagenome]|jgi:hypothetical protein
MATPSDPDVLLAPPSAAETAILARAVVAAQGGPTALTSLQQILISAVFHAMTGFTIDPAGVEGITAEQLAAALHRRNAMFRERIVQVMLLIAFSSRPLSLTTIDRIQGYAAALAVREDMIEVAHRFADGAFDLASIDFARNGYLGEVSAQRLAALHATTLDTSWSQVDDDPRLAEQWVSLEALPVGTIGRGVTDFYRDRGFVYPGRPNSAPPLLAQHDWVHVLADYGTSLENEIEVFAFMARANDDPRAFSLLAMVVSLFETGYLAAGAGLFEANPGHLATTGMATRLADAMRRGALTTGSHDLLDVDWFAIADRPITVLRHEIGLTPKSAAATAAGSVGPWQAGGITGFQLDAARRAALSNGVEYHPWAADPSRS